MLDTTCRPRLDDLHDLADAMGRHAFAAAAGALDLSPDDRQRAAGLELDAVEEIEAAQQVLGHQVGTDRAEAIRLVLLRGMRERINGLLAMTGE